MILSIDTSSETHRLALYAPGKISKHISWRRKETSKELLPKIDQFLRKNKVELKDLKTIVVFRGPGSFTGLRIGIAVAQALGFALDIPVVSTTKNIVKDTEKIYKSALLAQKSPPDKSGRQIKPVYLPVL